MSTPTEIAEAMAEAYRDRYDYLRTGPLEDPIEPCLAAALRAMPPGCDPSAVVNALEGLG
jgi:hypothetical protein